MYPARYPDPDRSPESLETRLRALPRLPVSADLEARLLATIPARRAIPPRRRAARAVAIAVSAAACLLTVFAWPRRHGESPVAAPGTVPPTDQASIRPPDESDRIAAWPEALKGPDGPGQLTFSWPLSQTSILTANAIPPDLLD